MLGCLSVSACPSLSNRIAEEMNTTCPCSLSQGLPQFLELSVEILPGTRKERRVSVCQSEISLFTFVLIFSKK